MIRVKNLVKFYGDFPALKGISFTVKKGEILGFLGPNAAGKTTTMRIITGYLTPTEGEVKVCNYDIFQNPLEVKKRIGYLPENPPLYGEMTVKSFLSFVAEIKGVPKEVRKRRIEEVMEKTGISSVSHRLISHISRGYQQRTGLASALINDPEVLILDEPTLGLDPKQIREIRELIRNLKGERTVFLSSHILPEVEAVCDRVVIIDQGEIKAEDTPEGLSRRVTKSLRFHLKLKKASENLIKELENLAGIKGVSATKRGEIVELKIDTTPDKDMREDIYHTVVNGKAVILEFRPVEMSLEDIFLRLTTREEEE